MTPLLLLLGVLAVLVPASVFYYFHVTHQANYYRERSFRALTEVSQIINLRLIAMSSMTWQSRISNEILWNTANEINLSTHQNLQITSDLVIIMPLGGKGP